MKCAIIDACTSFALSMFLVLLSIGDIAWSLCDSFGKAIEISINVEVRESTFEEMEEVDNLNDLGLSDKHGILKDRFLEQISSSLLKPIIRERTKHGPKSNRVKLQLVGNVASQSKNLRLGKGLSFSQEP